MQKNYIKNLNCQKTCKAAKNSMSFCFEFENDQKIKFILSKRFDLHFSTSSSVFFFMFDYIVLGILSRLCLFFAWTNRFDWSSTKSFATIWSILINLLNFKNWIIFDQICVWNAFIFNWFFEIIRQNILFLHFINRFQFYIEFQLSQNRESKNDKNKFVICIEKICFYIKNFWIFK